ncbi:MAG: nitroreductase family protein [Oscillospiraceae bacterium]|jgi:nitroreductase|nr:nitroreductase family protein [Oscillospiraceae bacterium]
MALDNEILRTIRNRRSTRKFSNKQITPEQLDTLLEAAIWAPSGSNSQSWKFTAIQNPEVLQKLNELVRSGFLERYEPDDDYPGKKFAKNAAANESYNFYYHAPTFIIASNVGGYANAIADCALGLENVFLAAESLGLGSCYINQLHWLENDAPVREYLETLDIPRDHVICASASIGYIAATSNALERKPGTVNIIR